MFTRQILEEFEQDWIHNPQNITKWIGMGQKWIKHQQEMECPEVE